MVALIVFALDAIQDQREWDEFSEDALAEYLDEFDALFNSLTVNSKATEKGRRVTVRRSNGRIARSTLVKAA